MSSVRGGNYWLDRQLFEHWTDKHAGDKRPEIKINASALADRFDVTRQQVQRSIKRLVQKWKLIELIRRPAGSVPVYQVNWDFTWKRKEHPYDRDPCPGHKQKNRGVQHLRIRPRVYFKEDDNKIEITVPHGIKQRFPMIVATGSFQQRRDSWELPLENPDSINWKPLINQHIREECEKEGFPWLVNEFTKRIENDDPTLFEAYHLKRELYFLFDELKESDFKETNLNYHQIVEWIQNHPKQQEEAWKKIRRGFSIVGRWIREVSKTARKQLNSLRQTAIREKEKKEYEPASGEGFQKFKQKMIERGIIDEDEDRDVA
jgi:hypothetical protein